MRNLMQDSVSVVSKDGSRRENIRALVQPKKILIDDATIPIAIGDRIERKLPSGQLEFFVIKDVHLWQGRGSIQSFYEITYKREGAQESHRRRDMLNLHISNSPQARINLHSSDQSVNVSDRQSDAIFGEIRKCLMESLVDSPDLDTLLTKLGDMEQSLEKGDFKSAYKEFVAAAANHMTILGPFLPGLAQLL